jgi:hypothetical protein
MSEMGPAEEERDPIAEEEAEAAAAEAAKIGGPGGYSDTDDPARRPLSEAGEGEAEGFELAEEQLEEIAEHGDQKRFPNREAGAPEEPTDTAFGEPDQAIPDDE